MIGEQILGYRVDEVIGSGSFGTVYKVSKTNASGTYVRALKHIKLPATRQQYNSVLNSMGGDYSKADDYFAAALKETVDEIRILSMLSESGVTNIVRYYENDIIETSHPKTYNIYMMMEYLTPFPEIVESRPMSVGEVIRVGKDILKALISCHQKNIIHRDIKDDNIFVTADGVYKLGDFGVSKKLQDKSRAASMRGTPNFIAPEVYLGKETYDCTVDLYSLGIVLYRLLNKLRGPFLPVFPAPYTSEDESAAFEARMTGKTPELPLMAQNQLGEAVRKAIMPTAQRYRSAQEFLDALEQAESALSREEWMSPAYEVYAPEGSTGADGKQNTTSIPDGNKTMGGLWFEADKEEEIRVGQNLFLTMGADLVEQIPVQKPLNDSDSVKPEVKTEEEKPVEIKKEKEKAKEKRKDRPNPLAGLKNQKSGEKTERKADSETGQKSGKPLNVKLLAVCAAAAVVLGVIFFILGAPLEIAGKEVEKDTTYLSLHKVTVTAEDMEAMARLKELRTVTLTDCVLSNAVMSQLKNLSPTLQDVSLTGCTGITDYSGIGAIVELRRLVLDNVQLTDEQLANMFQTAPLKLSNVDLSNNPALTNLSGLGSAANLEELCVSNTAVQDFSALQNCVELRKLTAQNNGISVLRTMPAWPELWWLDLRNNQISDLTGLELEHMENLDVLYLQNNQIDSLSALKQISGLGTLDVSGNLIKTLKPLSSHTGLVKLYANRNSLTNLEGLEQAISLKVLEVADNQITDINGASNCAVLERVNLSNNQIKDISILGKSKATLKHLYFHRNEVSDISALAGMPQLKTMGFDYNHVTNLDVLSESTMLEILSAAHNEIESIDGVKNSSKLTRIYLNHNRIQDMTAVAMFTANAENTIVVLDLSNNRIEELALTTGKKYTHLMVYNNPIKSYGIVADISVNNLYLSYDENVDFGNMGDKFKNVVMVSCPLDQQYNMNAAIMDVDYLSPYLEFMDSAELDEVLYADKHPDAMGTG